ncbi:MAG: hypothetical protein JST68_00405, partial [Bacteroidetes bacterium]|nr:hypothetical protein [Bacteroidota bacterium]
ELGLEEEAGEAGEGVGNFFIGGKDVNWGMGKIVEKGVDRELLQCILQLDEAEKKSVLQMLKTFLKGREKAVSVIIVEQKSGDDNTFVVEEGAVKYYIQAAQGNDEEEGGNTSEDRNQGGLERYISKIKSGKNISQNQELEEFLLQAPTFTSKQLAAIDETRKSINQWRKK